MRVNPYTENYEQVTVFGQPAIFTSLRLFRDKLPEGVYAYDVRHSDDGMDVAEIKESILVNHMGTILTKEPIKMDDMGSRIIEKDEDFNFEGKGDVSLEDFADPSYKPQKVINVVLVKPLQKPIFTQIDHSLKSFQNEVKGYIQVIYPFNEDVGLICNDEGKLIALPLNRPIGNDVIAGNFIIVGLDDDNGDFKSLTSEQADRYTKEFDKIYLVDKKAVENTTKEQNAER